MQQTPGHQALRKGRVSLPNQIYLLTAATAERKVIFTDPECARITCRTINNPDYWQNARLLCWVLMPDHWHGLLQLGENATLSRIMNRWKAAVSRELHRHGHAGPVWQRGFHDHALRQEEGVEGAARYIAANPVRAGLVESARQYPYWDSIWLEP